MANLDEFLKRLKQIAIELEDLSLTEDRYEPVANLAARIVDERKKQKITQKQLGELADLSTVTVRQIESGKTAASLANVQKVLNALGMSLWIK
jgi:DNA-binding XRE family transcriptional regulator